MPSIYFQVKKLDYGTCYKLHDVLESGKFFYTIIMYEMKRNNKTFQRPSWAWWTLQNASEQREHSSFNAEKVSRFCCVYLFTAILNSKICY